MEFIRNSVVIRCNEHSGLKRYLLYLVNIACYIRLRNYDVRIAKSCLNLSFLVANALTLYPKVISI